MTLSHLFKSATLAQEMLTRRDYLKRLYGESYAVHIGDAKRIVLAIASRDKKPIMETALWLCERAVREGHGSVVNFIVAAACDLIEGDL
jgi:hypothetical protein